MSASEEPKAQTWKGSGRRLERQREVMALASSEVARLACHAAEATGFVIYPPGTISELEEKGLTETYTLTPTNTLSEWEVNIWPGAFVPTKGLAYNLHARRTMTCDGSVTKAVPGVVVLYDESPDSTRVTLCIDELIADASPGSIEAELNQVVADFWQELWGAYSEWLAKQPPAPPAIMNALRAMSERLDTLQAVSIVSPSETTQAESETPDKGTTAPPREPSEDAADVCNSTITVPKREPERTNWRDAWKAINEMDDEERDVDDWGDDTTPTYEDYRDRLADRIHYKPSLRTLGKIIKAGRSGLLG